MMTRALLLIALETFLMGLVTLGCWQSVHLEPLQDWPYSRATNTHLVVASLVHSNLLRSEVVVLAQMNDLFNQFSLSCIRAVVRTFGAIL